MAHQLIRVLHQMLLMLRVWCWILCLSQRWICMDHPVMVIFFGFESSSEKLMNIYSIYGDETVVVDWNPTRPPPSTFTVPNGCFELPTTDGVPMGPVFPGQLTIGLTSGLVDETIYYDGPNQRFRIDSQDTTFIQIGSTSYSFSSDKEVSPVPCTYHSNSFTSPLPTFSKLIGTAMMGDQSLTLHGAKGAVWYWNTATNTPVLAAINTGLQKVTSYVVGAPDPSLFVPPSLCISSPFFSSAYRFEVPVVKPSFIKKS